MPCEPDSSPAAQLLAAIKANDPAAAANLLAAHKELRERIDQPIPGGSFGSTALLCAVNRGSRAMVDVLLSAGANIDARSDWWAGGFGVLDSPTPLADYLIERGATVDAHAAARLGRTERLQELIQADPACVHARGGDGQTPLHFAASVEVAALLLDHGADVNARDIDHESTPAQYMIKERQNVARYLMSRGASVDLLMAAALGDIPLARTCLEENPDAIRMSVSEKWFPKRNPRAGGSIYIWTLGMNKTAQTVARDFGRTELFEFLWERTPAPLKLALACEWEDEPLARKLLAEDSKIPATLTEDETRRLACAAQDERPRAVELMLKYGWPVNALGQHGGAALHWACFHGHAAMAESILKHSPSLELRDADYKSTPLQWAIHGSLEGWRRDTGNYAATVEALLEAGSPLPPHFCGSEPVQTVLKRFMPPPVP